MGQNFKALELPISNLLAWQTVLFKYIYISTESILVSADTSVYSAGMSVFVFYFMCKIDRW